MSFNYVKLVVATFETKNIAKLTEALLYFWSQKYSKAYRFLMKLFRNS